MTRTLTTCAIVALAAGTASASNVNITFENLQPAGGLSFTPLWIGIHNNTFNNFDPGSPASDFDGIEQIAELGDVSAQSARNLATQADAFDGVLFGPGAPPVFGPGESSSMTYDVGDATINRYFSYASMVVPTNDLFIGNGNAVEIFDADGNFLGPITIEIFGSNVWDAGTEVNDIENGPAFIPGQDAEEGAEEGGVITSFLSQDGAADYLTSIVGVETAAGDTISTTFGEADLIARITIVPSPGGVVAFAALGLAAAARRRR